MYSGTIRRIIENSGTNQFSGGTVTISSHQRLQNLDTRLLFSTANTSP